MSFGAKLVPTSRGNRRGGMSARIAPSGGARSPLRLVLAFSKAMAPNIPVRKVDAQFGFGADTGMVLLTFVVTGSFPLVKNGKFDAHKVILPIPPEVPSGRALPTRPCTFEWREGQMAINLPITGWKADFDKLSGAPLSSRGGARP